MERINNIIQYSQCMRLRSCFFHINVTNTIGICNHSIKILKINGNLSLIDKTL